MKNLIFTTLAIVAAIVESQAFCGFYVTKADASLFNESFQVIIARNGQKSVITMSSDFKGDVRDFAMVVPVPNVLKENDIRVVNQLLFDKLDAYSAPRLAEYYDPNPCQQYVRMYSEVAVAEDMSSRNRKLGVQAKKEKDYKVTIEATYTVGEYNILILSAKESDGLKRWLNDNEYKIPEKAEEVLSPYIKSGMKFFVVKVDLLKQKKLGFQQLRPLQLTVESNKFMLPLRLGMANSNGTQDLIVYALTQSGRTETTNYRTVGIPSDRDVPLFVENQFGKFYQDVFQKTWEREGKNAVHLEYAWDLSSTNSVKCDPCVSPPPIFTDLKEAGAFWLQNAQNQWGSGYTGNVFFTRLHVRYSRDKFPQDLFFQETPNRQRHQGRYVLHKPATGSLDCDGAKDYYEKVAQRRQKELHELSALTGWDVSKYDYYVDAYASKAGWYESGQKAVEEDPIYYNPYSKNLFGLLFGLGGSDGGGGGSSGGAVPVLFGLMVLSVGLLLTERFFNENQAGNRLCS